VFAYGARRYGIRHFVVDSLMMLADVPEEGKGAFEAQRQFMSRVTAFAKQFAAHVNVVAHPRKAADERSGPGKLDVSGSGKITNMADNVFSVWARLREETEADDGSPDAKVELLKQRNGEAQHRAMYLWFEAKSLQYCISNRRRCVKYLPDEQMEGVRNA
jgi:twinkle protein